MINILEESSVENSLRLAGWLERQTNASLVSSRLPLLPFTLSPLPPRAPFPRSNRPTPWASYDPPRQFREADGKKRRGERSLTRGRRPLPDPTLPPPLPARPPRDRDYAQIKLGSLLRSDSAPSGFHWPRVCFPSRSTFSSISGNSRLSEFEKFETSCGGEDDFVQSGRKVYRFDEWRNSLVRLERTTL